MNFFLNEDEGPADLTRVSAGPEKDYVGDYLSNLIDFEDAEAHSLSWLLLGCFHSSSATNGERSVQTLVGGIAPPARRSAFTDSIAWRPRIPFEFSARPITMSVARFCRALGRVVRRVLPPVAYHGSGSPRWK